MKIYTKTGDDGTTSLAGGTRVSKTDARIECYGTIDELNSYIGLIRDTFADVDVQKQLLDIQNNLFLIGGWLANEQHVSCGISDQKISLLEQQIDKISAELPPLNSFILPGGHIVSSYCQIARTVCRRGERRICSLDLEEQGKRLSTIYINRLSDYLFVLARKVLKDFNKSEITWNPSL
ncbi:MAG: cob(I)yrinic acid a,c-diamide adenosyltransferase [Bacteroidales bacterium]|nr:cob(I)yrinic acid a,c-diamide adenosyltransferase [Bacteroidales bacterium]